MKKVDTLLITLFIFITCFAGNFSSSLFAQTGSLVKIGEIQRIDSSTEVVEVILSDKRFINLVGVNTPLLVLDQEHNEMGQMRMISHEVVKNAYVIRCEITSVKKNFYVGEAVGVKLLKKDQPMLRDETRLEKAPEKEFLNAKDSSQMVLIPEGPFIFGSDIPGTDHYTTPIEYDLTEIQREQGKKRARYLSLPSFYIDRYEVTMGQFKQYLLESGTQTPPGWDESADPLLPVVNLSYVQAERYCQWAGKRLPTELEWEKSARGTGITSSFEEDDVTIYREKINVYPTGLEFDPQACITRDTTNRLTSIHNLGDKNEFGLYGTCGNAAEWTSSWYLPYRGNSLKNINYGRKFKVIRGGAFNLPSKWTRGYERMFGGIPSLQEDYRAGVRCARNTR